MRTAATRRLMPRGQDIWSEVALGREAAGQRPLPRRLRPGRGEGSRGRAPKRFLDRSGRVAARRVWGVRQATHPHGPRPPVVTAKTAGGRAAFRPAPLTSNPGRDRQLPPGIDNHTHHRGRRRGQ
jgi:hypothetical protein